MRGCGRPGHGRTASQRSSPGVLTDPATHCASHGLPHYRPGPMDPKTQGMLALCCRYAVNPKCPLDHHAVLCPLCAALTPMSRHTAAMSSNRSRSHTARWLSSRCRTWEQPGKECSIGQVWKTEHSRNSVGKR